MEARQSIIFMSAPLARAALIREICFVQTCAGFIAERRFAGVCAHAQCTTRLGV